ncbi:hypothetical protein FRB94_007876 [Tulasnella sp. JGI-2019a]|nr:hypothetical protein FRB94_007876 [Tulasnella sp. JGI-2019a]
MPSQCTAPRPILKTSSRKSSTSSTSSLDSFPTPPPTPSSSKGPCVQFSQCLSTTYLAYSSVDYNRSPITVTPNTCALPSRGRCNGSSSSNEEGVALRQFRLEAEGRPVPALIHDDGDSSSEESGQCLPIHHLICLQQARLHSFHSIQTSPYRIQNSIPSSTRYPPRYSSLDATRTLVLPLPDRVHPTHRLTPHTRQHILYRKVPRLTALNAMISLAASNFRDHVFVFPRVVPGWISRWAWTGIQETESV